MRFICCVLFCISIVAVDAHETKNPKLQKNISASSKKMPTQPKKKIQYSPSKHVKDFQIRKSTIEKSAQATIENKKKNDKTSVETAKVPQKSPQDPSFHQSVPSYVFDKKHPSVANFKSSQHQLKYAIEGHKIRQQRY